MPWRVEATTHWGRFMERRRAWRIQPKHIKRRHRKYVFSGGKWRKGAYKGTVLNRGTLAKPNLLLSNVHRPYPRLSNGERFRFTCVAKGFARWPYAFKHRQAWMTDADWKRERRRIYCGRSLRDQPRNVYWGAKWSREQVIDFRVWRWAMYHGDWPSWDPKGRSTAAGDELPRDYINRVYYGL